MEHSESENTKKLNAAIDERLFDELEKIDIIKKGFDLNRLFGKIETASKSTSDSDYQLNPFSLIDLLVWLSETASITDDLLEQQRLNTARHVVDKAFKEKLALLGVTVGFPND